MFIQFDYSIQLWDTPMYPVRMSGRTECNEASEAFNSLQLFPFPLTTTFFDSLSLNSVTT